MTDKPGGCLLCQAPATYLEGPLSAGGWFCNCCGRVFDVDAGGRLVRWATARPQSAFRQAVAAARNGGPTK